MKKWFLLILLPLQIQAQQFSPAEISRWQTQAQRVTIIRDNWGIPHIYGKRDADAVFGLMYAQCEDDFKRVEYNYIEKLGRLAEVKGSSELYNDLMLKMLIDTADAKYDYDRAPAWLKQLCNAFADGINYYLYKHPGTNPLLLKRFQPWYPMLWTDGSIGAINTAGINADDVKQFYSGGTAVTASTQSFPDEDMLTGSNGFAFAPKITASGHAILYINPHVTFYFRPEVHIVSDEGLNAYGAVTWGQFFIYQGFNEHCGWMHTSSAVDAADLYIEQLTQHGDHYTYRYNNFDKPVDEKKITVNYRDDNGAIAAKSFTVLYTHHGPIMAKRNGNLLSMRADNRLSSGLQQCWLRTKSTNMAAFKQTLDLKGNISNNTVYADAAGNIAYWHGNRIPKRDNAFNWNEPVDGTTPATEWKGYHSINDIVQCINPVNGWLQNCNSTPFTVAGINSPLRNHYPAYMAPDGENYRGINAVHVLSRGSRYTLDKVIASGYDNYLAAFEKMIPALVAGYDKLSSNNDTTYTKLGEVIHVIKNWNFRCDTGSVATTLAVMWGEKLLPKMNRISSMAAVKYPNQVLRTETFIAQATPQDLLEPLMQVVTTLQQQWGTWQVAWGSINRFQRISAAVDNQFDDNQYSIPVGFASSQWGMLPSYSSKNFSGSLKRYGVNGNSFICAVEFGKKITAKSLLAGGESGDEHSPHFFDQGKNYANGVFKDVLFYKQDVLQHIERQYHPGE